MVVGKAKVMSYKDIVEVQEKRAAKEAAKDTSAAKGSRGRKRKNPMPEATKAKKVRRSEAEVAEEEIAAAGLEDHCSVLQF
jgi:hypothetical protein